MELLYGTGNQAKLTSMKRALADLNLKITGLKELSHPIPEVDETGNSPLENARIKAAAYYRAFQKPVFSCDSGLYFDNLPDSLQPGVHVRNINGQRLTDEEMITYYSSLAFQFGDLKGRYRNAVCFIYDKNNIYESMADNLSGGYFLLTAKPHKKRVDGFPLDSLSLDIASGKYYYDLNARQTDDIALNKGFSHFFETALRKIADNTEEYKMQKTN